MTDALFADVASASLSQVDCPLCGGRLYTDHQAGCPIPLSQERRDAELVALMTQAVGE